MFWLYVFSIIGITSLSKNPRYPFFRESPRGTPLIISWFWISKVLSYKRVTRTAACEWVCIHAPARRNLYQNLSRGKITCRRRGREVCMPRVSGWGVVEDIVPWTMIGQTYSRVLIAAPQSDTERLDTSFWTALGAIKMWSLLLDEYCQGQLVTDGHSPSSSGNPTVVYFVSFNQRKGLNCRIVDIIHIWDLLDALASH